MSDWASVRAAIVSRDDDEMDVDEADARPDLSAQHSRAWLRATISQSNTRGLGRYYLFSAVCPALFNYGHVPRFATQTPPALFFEHLATAITSGLDIYVNEHWDPVVAHHIRLVLDVDIPDEHVDSMTPTGFLSLVYKATKAMVARHCNHVPPEKLEMVLTRSSPGSYHIICPYIVGPVEKIRTLHKAIRGKVQQLEGDLVASFIDIGVHDNYHLRLPFCAGWKHGELRPGRIHVPALKLVPTFDEARQKYRPELTELPAVDPRDIPAADLAEMLKKLCVNIPPPALSCNFKCPSTLTFRADNTTLVGPGLSVYFGHERPSVSWALFCRRLSRGTTAPIIVEEEGQIARDLSTYFIQVNGSMHHINFVQDDTTGSMQLVCKSASPTFLKQFKVVKEVNGKEKMLPFNDLFYPTVFDEVVWHPAPLYSIGETIDTHVLCNLEGENMKYNLFTGFNYALEHSLEQAKDSRYTPLEMAEIFFLPVFHFWNDNDAHGSELMFSFFAKLFQAPHVRPQWVAVVSSHEQGAGKGIVCAVIETLLGKEHVLMATRTDSVMGTSGTGATANLDRTILIVMDEADMSNSREMKAFVTNEKVHVKRLYEDAEMKRIFCSLIALTNYKLGISIEASDRRSKWMYINPDNYQDKEYWDEYAEALETPVNLAALSVYLHCAPYNARLLQQRPASHKEKVYAQYHSITPFQRWVAAQILHSGNKDVVNMEEHEGVTRVSETLIAKERIQDLRRAGVPMNNSHSWVQALPFKDYFAAYRSYCGIELKGKTDANLLAEMAELFLPGRSVVADFSEQVRGGGTTLRFLLFPDWDTAYKALARRLQCENNSDLDDLFVAGLGTEVGVAREPVVRTGEEGRPVPTHMANGANWATTAFKLPEIDPIWQIQMRHMFARKYCWGIGAVRRDMERQGITEEGINDAIETAVKEAAEKHGVRAFLEMLREKILVPVAELGRYYEHVDQYLEEVMFQAHYDEVVVPGMEL
jgi:hypothetical protein